MSVTIALRSYKDTIGERTTSRIRLGRTDGNPDQARLTSDQSSCRLSPPPSLAPLRADSLRPPYLIPPTEQSDSRASLDAVPVLLQLDSSMRTVLPAKDCREEVLDVSSPSAVAVSQETSSTAMESARRSTPLKLSLVPQDQESFYLAAESPREAACPRKAASSSPVHQGKRSSSSTSRSSTSTRRSSPTSLDGFALNADPGPSRYKKKRSSSPRPRLDLECSSDVASIPYDQYPTSQAYPPRSGDRPSESAYLINNGLTNWEEAPVRTKREELEDSAGVVPHLFKPVMHLRSYVNARWAVKPDEQRPSHNPSEASHWSKRDGRGLLCVDTSDPRLFEPPKKSSNGRRSRRARRLRSVKGVLEGTDLVLVCGNPHDPKLGKKGQLIGPQDRVFERYDAWEHHIRDCVPVS